MDLDRIRELLQVVAESDVAEVEIEEGGLKLVVRKDAPNVTLQSAMPFMPSYASAPYPMPAAFPPPANPASEPAPQAPAAPTPNPGTEPDSAATSLPEVKAPIVGTFYRSPSPDADPFVEVGDSVAAGQVLCIVEAMKLMNEIEAETAGVIAKRFVKNSQPIEYGEALFAIRPS